MNCRWPSLPVSSPQWSLGEELMVLLLLILLSWLHIPIMDKIISAYKTFKNGGRSWPPLLGETSPQRPCIKKVRTWESILQQTYQDVLLVIKMYLVYADAGLWDPPSDLVIDCGMAPMRLTTIYWSTYLTNTTCCKLGREILHDQCLVFCDF